MAFGIGEKPELSPAAILQEVDYPATRETFVLAAEDSGAPVDAINFLKSMPDREYASADEALRYFAEADARFGMWSKDVQHRGDIGKEMIEPPGEHAHHP
ncbi:DUF2795 domain-containing protein [Vulgatibacter incomptus]|uniref:DUF2795 domain-containing protein n=1 Tax=Vulgatibacter incomptus TaxID=1391653 RepID=A0A0K1PH08_9BACT|nr:DUF2795 domain-containing protein [Vulgatibacter incomptus]AKU92800.1 hypothetical protein AKJ08_3187 [Vulgatibacter incomptus]